MTLTTRRRVYAGLWVFAAALLMVRAIPYLEELARGRGVNSGPLALGISIGTALVIGYVKGRFVLRKAARKAVARLAQQGDTAPLRTVFPTKLVVLVASMMALGLALRSAPYPEGVKYWLVGILYPGIGMALLWGAWELLVYVPGPMEGHGDLERSLDP